MSDVDVLTCLKKPLSPEEIWGLRRKIINEAIDKHGLPWDYPIELHVHNMKECGEILKHCRKYIEILS